MRCKDCGHAISVNKICERPIQAATDMLKHMAAHNASRPSRWLRVSRDKNLRPSSQSSHCWHSLRCRGPLRALNYPTKSAARGRLDQTCLFREHH